MLIYKSDRKRTEFTNYFIWASRVCGDTSLYPCLSLITIWKKNWIIRLSPEFHNKLIMLRFLITNNTFKWLRSCDLNNVQLKHEENDITWVVNHMNISIKRHIKTLKQLFCKLNHHQAKWINRFLYSNMVKVYTKKIQP